MQPLRAPSSNPSRHQAALANAKTLSPELAKIPLPPSASTPMFFTKVSVSRGSQARDECVGAFCARSLPLYCACDHAGVLAVVEPPPPRGPSSPPSLSRSQHTHRDRLDVRITPVPSARFPEPRSAATASRSTAAMAPPPRTTPPLRAIPPGPRSTVDRWTQRPRPGPQARAVDRPVPKRRVAGQQVRRGQPWPFCEKAPALFGN